MSAAKQTAAYIVCLLAVAGARVPAAQPVEFVFITPNSGKSAGGHCGIRLGDRIYHLGVDDHALLIKRDPWEEFVRRYRMLDNRRMETTRLGLTPEDASRVKARFDKRFLVQEKLRDRMWVLELEDDWLRSLAGEAGAELRLSGAGYFDADSADDAVADRLRRAVGRRHGEKFLEAQARAVRADLQCHALEVSEVPPGPLANDRFPSPGELAADRLRDRLSLLEAIRVLAEGRALLAEAVMFPDAAELDEREVRKLEDFRRGLEESVCRLLVSHRPDRGAALLIAVARYQAVTRTLREKRWVVLDVLDDENVLLEARDVRRNRDLVEALGVQVDEAWRIVRKESAGNSMALNQVTYGRFESMACRSAEVAAVLREERDLRSPGNFEALIPRREGGVALPPGLNVPVDEARGAMKESASNLVRYRKAFSSCYSYSLFRKNCATELLREMVAAFPDAEVAREALGPLPLNGEGFTFVPSALSRYFREHEKASGWKSLPSWRQEQVGALVEASNGTERKIRRRESNRWTATVYPGSVNDDTFLFFADDTPPARRPLRGIVNTGYGLLKGCAGLVTLPADRGRRAKAGFKGAVYSLPEVIGVSIRKGRYDIVPLEAETFPGE